jgi:hypothetical protein
MKLRIDCKAFTYNVSVVLMVALAISITGLAVGMMTKQWRAQSQIFQLDLAESRILVNQNSGHGKITLVIKNIGTTTAKVWKFSIGTDSDDLIVYFNNPIVFLSDNTGGTISISSSKVVLQGGELIVASGQSASITFPNSGTWDGKSYFTAGKQYLILAYPSTGEHVVSQPLVVESFGG